MTSTTFVDQQTVIMASWLNDVNTATYTTVPANTTAIAGKAALGANTDITSLGGLTTPLSQGQGGTGATTTAGARTNLGAAASGLATASGLTQSTNKLLGRTTASTGAIEEISVGTGLIFAAGSLSAATSVQVQPISASVAANALTISASALALDFRSATLTSGTVTPISGTPSNLVVPSSATLGTTNAIQSDLYILALNNAGTIELAVINSTGGVDLSETGVISTTAISAAATSASVIYSTTAHTNVAYRVIGLIRSTQATAGTWATAPSLIQGAGGQAVTAMSSFGYGQTWQDVTASRSLGTSYYNTTGKTIFVEIILDIAVSTTASGIVNGFTKWQHFAQSAATRGTIVLLVPAGGSYSANTGTVVSNGWNEYR